jgi:hypothetical protein
VSGNNIPKFNWPNVPADCTHWNSSGGWSDILGESIDEIIIEVLLDDIDYEYDCLLDGKLPEGVSLREATKDMDAIVVAGHRRAKYNEDMVDHYARLIDAVLVAMAIDLGSMCADGYGPAVSRLASPYAGSVALVRERMSGLFITEHVAEVSVDIRKWLDAPGNTKKFMEKLSVGVGG